MASAEDVLAGLDPEQRAVAEALRGPVCVLAGAGTGKTRAITHRIAYGVRAGVYVPQSVLAVTFTTRAAGEMRARLQSLGAVGVQARTFHSAALRQLRYFWPDVVGGEQPRIAETKAPLIAEALSRQRVHPDQALVRDLASEIEWAKVSRIAAESYAERATAARRTVASLDASMVGRVYAAYDEVKRRRGLFDFEDVLLFVVGMLEETPRVAAMVRGQYRQLVVDEYQDVSPLQERLLELWLGDRNDLCVVGDPSQTIYSFAGADQRYLLDFPERHPGATVIRLERNYRSTTPIITLANSILSGSITSGPAGPGPAGSGPSSSRPVSAGQTSARSVSAGPERSGATGTRGGGSARVQLVLRSQRGDGPQPRFRSYADEPTEAAAVAAAIGKVIANGTQPRDIAVLYRVNAQGLAYEQALTEAGIPYVVRGSERFFERPEVKQAITLFRGALRAASGDPDGASGTLVQAVDDVLAGAGWKPEPPAGTGAVRTRWESLRALADLAGDLAAERPDATLADFVADLQERASVQHAPVADGVTLATLHAAKGLEWDAVFLIGLVEGTMPIVHAETTAEIEEEARLLYVGLTRARTHCWLSWAYARSPGGRQSREPSRFLDRVIEASAPTPRPARPTRTRSRGPTPCRVCGRTLFTAAERKLGRCESCPSTADEVIFDRLRTWRSAVAAEAKLPAYCVFTDSTLLAIAEAVPTNTDELARIPGIGRVKLERYGRTVLDLIMSPPDA